MNNNVYLKIYRYIIYIFIFLVGMYLIFLKSCSWYLWLENENDVHKKISKVYSIIDEVVLPNGTQILKKGSVKRAYSYGYLYTCKNDTSYQNILKFYISEFNSRGYDVDILDNGKKLKAKKDDYAIIIQEKDDLLNNYYDKGSWTIYVKPDDIFEWKYLDFDYFTI